MTIYCIGGINVAAIEIVSTIFQYRRGGWHLRTTVVEDRSADTPWRHRLGTIVRAERTVVLRCQSARSEGCTYIGSRGSIIDCHRHKNDDDKSPQGLQNVALDLYAGKPHVHDEEHAIHGWAASVFATKVSVQWTSFSWNGHRGSTYKRPRWDPE